MVFFAHLMAFVAWFMYVLGLLSSCDGEEVFSSIVHTSQNNEAQYLVQFDNESNQSLPVKDPTNNKSQTFDPQHPPYWPLRKSAATTPDDSDRPSPHCNLRPVTWANFTQGFLIFPSRFGVDQLFHSSDKMKQSFGFNQRPQSVHTRPTVPATHDCYILFLYSLDCPISYSAFPYVRGLARAYPQFRVYAVRIEDYMANHWSMRMMFVPKIKIMVNGRVLSEYSSSYIGFYELVNFVWTNTHELPKGPVIMKIEDYDDEYPPEPVPKTDWCLIISWITVIMGLFYISFVCWETAVGHLRNVIHRASGGRYGYSRATNAHTGAILDWVSGQNRSAH